MDISAIDLIKEFGALVIVAIIVLATIKWGFPAMFAYFKHKDTQHREDIMSLNTQHREDMTALIASSREEREAFYKHCGIQFDKIHERLDRIESSVIKPP